MAYLPDALSIAALYSPRRAARLHPKANDLNSIRERITLAYFTIRSFFTDLTPLTLLAISPALSTAWLRSNEAAQLNAALVSFDTDLE